MCGIIGAFKPVNEIRTDVLNHRGPDDSGVWEDRDIALCHTRLKIIDLSEKASQPMLSQEERYVIVYNGEIYNFQYIRKELINRGYQFNSNSDTEVLLKAYIEWGLDALNKFNGMFAFGIWDTFEKELIVARDRYGVKPLVYYWDGKTFIFSSEIKGIIQHKADSKINMGINLKALKYFFSYSYIPAPHTIFENIYKLEPGHMLMVNKTPDSIQLKKKQWYSLTDSTHNAIAHYEEGKTLLKENLAEAVRLRMIADVPLGAFLSGGIDSSIVVGLMSSLSGKPVKTFSIGYKNDTMFDETVYAKELALLHNTDHTEIKVDYKDVLSVIPDILDFIDEPFGDSSVIPTYIVSRETKKHVTVALSGDGADEVFGGYIKYLGEYFYSIYHMIPMFISRILFNSISKLPSSKHNKIDNTIRMVKKFRRGVSDDQWLRHYKWMEILNRDVFNSMSFLSEAEPAQWIKGFYESGEVYDNINKMLYTDISTCLPNDMLLKVDWMSMANSLEVRSPFLDYNVVELAMSFPGNYKINKSHLKRILKDSFSDILPAKIKNRSKQGFEVPVGEWFKNELKDLFFDSLNHGGGMLNRKEVEQVYADHVQAKEDYTILLWCILVYCWWEKRSKSYA